MLTKLFGGAVLALCCSSVQPAGHGSTVIGAGAARQALLGATLVPRTHALNWTPRAAFLVSPVPEPTTYAMLAVGLGLVVVAGRRQRRFLLG